MKVRSLLVRIDCCLTDIQRYQRRLVSGRFGNFPVQLDWLVALKRQRDYVRQVLQLNTEYQLLERLTEQFNVATDRDLVNNLAIRIGEMESTMLGPIVDSLMAILRKANFVRQQAKKKLIQTAIEGEPWHRGDRASA
ncbi:Hypothetical_protein [Hexamita inflata]|uniref:Hypothetical_protein n=1 Tax=Hexamita inflata TaxID=28002 RepID=A0AA86P1N7_9EUKA|nr:Hypothetical protein HINF_LOCUS17120 [Hexamita inflata]